MDYYRENDHQHYGAYGPQAHYHQQPPSQQSPQQHHHQHRAEVTQQLSRHHDLERGLNRIEESHTSRGTGEIPGMGPFLAQVVMEECREAKIRRQNRQVAISAGVAIGLIVAVIWFVVTR